MPTPAKESVPPLPEDALRRKVAFYLFLGAAAVHLLFLMQLAGSPFFWVPRLDALYHDVMARQILDGKLPAEAFFRAPAYGYFLAVLYGLFGGQNYVAVRAIHALLGAVSVVLIYQTGCRLFSFRVAVLAGVTMALYGPLVYLISDLHTSVLEVLFAAAFALFYVEALHRRDEAGNGNDRTSSVLWAGAGLSLGLWAITRPNALVVLFPALLGMGLRDRRALAVFLAAWAVFPLLVTARNIIIGKDAVFIASQGGINLFLGNRPQADGFTPSTPTRYDFAGEYEDSVAVYGRRAAEEAVGHPLKPSEINAYWLKRSGEFWRTDPGTALRLTGKKFVLAFTRREVRNNTAYDYMADEWTPVLRFFPVGFWYAGPFGLLGIALCWRTHPRTHPLAGAVLLYILSFVPFFIADRYRLPVVPYLLLFAAHAVCTLWDAIHEKRLRGLAPALATLGVLLIFVNVEWFPTVTPAIRAEDTWSAGNRLIAQGQMTGTEAFFHQAEAQMRKALTLDSANPDIWSGLGESLYYQKRFPEAAAAFAEGIRRSPLPRDLMMNLATCYQLMGKPADARAVLTDLLRTIPGYPPAVKMLGELANPAQTPARP